MVYWVHVMLVYGDISKRFKRLLSIPETAMATLTVIISRSGLEIAAAFGVAPVVEFVEWEDWFDRMGEMSASALYRRSYNEARLAGAARTRKGAPFASVVKGTVSTATEDQTPSSVGHSLRYAAA